MQYLSRKKNQKNQKQGTYTKHNFDNKRINYQCNKHAQAQEITIDISAHEKDIVVMVTDNGKGFDKNKIKNGQGLNYIKNRTELWGGNTEIDSNTKNGTTITATFLLNIIK